MDSLEESLTCFVCFEDFQNEGDHVPRLLPCTHTLCELCISRLVQNNSLRCPKCNREHEARGANFRQNGYILTMLRRLGERDGIRRCQLHQDEEETLFCKEAECQKPICKICLSEHHRRHEVVALTTEQKLADERLRINRTQPVRNFSQTFFSVARMPFFGFLATSPLRLRPEWATLFTLLWRLYSNRLRKGHTSHTLVPILASRLSNKR